ncbi:MAG: CBS domain-containing protein [Candidatus Coatesbacteria bacterium]|nr:CBS domain-containing protein [Candidatus Coatesbacteria bacterium]
MLNDKTLDGLTVGDVRNLVVQNPSTITLDQDLEDLMAKMLEDTRTRHVYVVDDEGILIGSVRLATLVEHLFPLSSLITHSMALTMGNLPSFESKTIEELMDSEPCWVTESTLLSEMAAILVEKKINELPVVDEKHRVIGEVNFLEVIAAYLNRTSPDR